MQHSSTRTLFNYWNELRGSRSAPERKNVDPTKIRHALSNTFILQATAEDDFAFRLAGSHLCSAYCRELKGRPFENLWSNRDQDAIRTLIKAVTEDHAAALITFEGISQSNNKMAFETILLPLRHNGCSTNRILGAMSASEEPYWFGAQPIIDQRITGLRLIWPDDLASSNGFVSGAGSHHVSSMGMNDVIDARQERILPTAANVHGRKARRYAHLAVIDGGRDCS